MFINVISIGYTKIRINKYANMLHKMVKYVPNLLSKIVEFDGKIFENKNKLIPNEIMSF